MNARTHMAVHPAWRSRGFTMVEVMVAVIIIAIGMLGIAKMQAVALSSTGAARMRSLAAIEASSLAAAMHTNRGYWAAATAPTFTVTGATFAVSSGALGTGAISCVSGAVGSAAPCNNLQLASADVQTWVAALKVLLPQDTGTVTCVTATPPVYCTIQISWTENMVGANQQEANVATTNIANGTTTNMAIQTPTYTLYVVP